MGCGQRSLWGGRAGLCIEACAGSGAAFCHQSLRFSRCARAPIEGCKGLGHDRKAEIRSKIINERCKIRKCPGFNPKDPVDCVSKYCFKKHRRARKPIQMVGGVTEGIKSTEVDPINIVEGSSRRTSTCRALDEEYHTQLLEDAEELQEYMMAEDGEQDEPVESGTESPESQGTVGDFIMSGDENSM